MYPSYPVLSYPICTAEQPCGGLRGGAAGAGCIIKAAAAAAQNSILRLGMLAVFAEGVNSSLRSHTHALLSEIASALCNCVSEWPRSRALRPTNDSVE